MPHAESVNKAALSDREKLLTLRKRFVLVNNARLARTKSALESRQQIFLELLPMLFHINHPMLPGYISPRAPSGLESFKPTRVMVQKAQRLARSFSYKDQPPEQCDIVSIWLLGSCGTVAQKNAASLSIAIGHRQQLNEQQLEQLRQKTDALSHWASSFDLQVDFSLMAPPQYRLDLDEPLADIESYRSLNNFQLDQLYHSGLLIGGRIPAWWLVPAKLEKHYEQYLFMLRKKQLIDSEESLDFGRIGEITAAEFIEHSAGHLNRAIDNPYEATLYVIMSEIYAAVFPKIEPLSRRFKTAIHSDQVNLDELDPDVMMYRQIEQHLLQRNEPKRLELVRRCFYFKADEQLSQPSATSLHPWKRQLIEKLVSEWQWPADYLQQLDDRQQWKISQAIGEQKELVRELTNNYRFLLEFVRNCNSADTIDPEPMNILGRKLFAAFERKAGKVERINPTISANLAEEQLCFYQTADKRAWAVSAEVISANETYKTQPLKRSNSLISLLSWCQVNGLTHTRTRLSIIEGDHGINDFELQNMARSLREKMPSNQDIDAHPLEGKLRYSANKRPVSIQLFINVGASGVDSTNKPLNIPDTMAIANIEEVILNNWGEVTTRRFDGEFALIRCLREYLQMLPPGKDVQPPPLDAYCFTANRASSTAGRVEKLFSDINSSYYQGSHSAHNRYVLQLQKYFFVLQFDHNRPNIERAENYEKLLELLGKTQNQYSATRLDSHCLNNSVLAAVLKSAKPDCIQIYYQQRGESADVYVLDEMGSLHTFSTPFRDEHTLLAPLDQFMHSMSFRESTETTDSDTGSAFSFQHYRLEYYEISGPDDGLQINRCGLSGDTGMGYFFNVQAIGERDIHGRIVFNIYCDQNEFTELELGAKLFDTVAKFIIDRRESRERYPCYITDLDLSRCINRQRRGAIQTTDYLRYKQKLEKALNHALQNI